MLYDICGCYLYKIYDIPKINNTKKVRKVEKIPSFSEYKKYDKNMCLYNKDARQIELYNIFDKKI